MTSFDAEDRKRAYGAQMLSKLGVTLVECALFGLLCAVTLGAITAAALFAVRIFQLDGAGAMIVIAAMVILWMPAAIFSLRASSRIAYVIWPETMKSPAAKVEITDEGVASFLPGKPSESVLWRDLAEVHIVNQDSWPIGTQYWLLVGKDGKGAVVPTDAVGASDLISEMQKRLPGFDNRTFVVAMGSTGGSFQVWPAA